MQIKYTPPSRITLTLPWGFQRKQSMPCMPFIVDHRRSIHPSVRADCNTHKNPHKMVAIKLPPRPAQHRMDTYWSVIIFPLGMRVKYITSGDWSSSRYETEIGMRSWRVGLFVWRLSYLLQGLWVIIHYVVQRSLSCPGQVPVYFLWTWLRAERWR